MALPTLILAPIAGFIGALVTKLVDALTTLFTKKFLIAASLIIAMFAALSVIFNQLNTYINSFDPDAIPVILVNGVSLLPSNTITCITIVLSVKTAVFVYNTQMKVISIKASS